jgi:uncharacterized protein (TIGR02421 family)
MIADVPIQEVLQRLALGQRVRRQLPGGGRLYVDLPLPFLCVYRKPNWTADNVIGQLISTESSYLIAPGGKHWRSVGAELLQPLVTHLAERFDSFLVLEIWEKPHELVDPVTHEESGEPLLPRMQFRIHSNTRQPPEETVRVLARSLARIRLFKQLAEVEELAVSQIAPPGMKSLLAASVARRMNVHTIGVELEPAYRDPQTGAPYPTAVRTLRRGLGRSVNRAVLAFARYHTNIQPRHYHTLGRRSFVKALWEVDRQLAEIESSFDLLLSATPTNADAAWLDFKRSRFQTPPRFRYHPPTVDPIALKRRLFEVPITRIEDATMADLFRQKQDELDRKITMLSDIDTRKFLLGSRQVFGDAGRDLVTLAEEILVAIRPRTRGHGKVRKVPAQEFVELARKEIEGYRLSDPDFTPSVSVKDDFYSGLIVSYGNLFVGKRSAFIENRVDALLQHEVGIHLVTYHNGSAQPFRQLAVGLAGYDGLQEGLAVLAEYFSGGLDRDRLRLLAARVVGVHRLLQGATFLETFTELREKCDLPQRTAYLVAMRVYRGGGLTKDASYLSGLVEVLEYFRDGGEIEPLLVGKMAADHVPLINELRLREVLRPPPLRPRFFEYPGFSQKMAYVRSGVHVLDLMKEEKR